MEYLQKYYAEDEHKSTCKALAEKIAVSPQSINGTITAFGKAVQKHLDRFVIKGLNAKDIFWIVPMKGRDVEENLFEWTLRENLIIAMENLKLTREVNYFIGGFTWGDKGNQKERFIENGIWENGYQEDKFVEVVNKVCIGDIFALKSTFTYKASNILRIHRIGIVKEILSNWQLGIEWGEHMQKDITGIRWYANTIENIINQEDINKIFGDMTDSSQNTTDPIVELLEAKKQIILQGAPGTGKTYKTAEIAVAMCDGSAPSDREKLMARYKELCQEGRIGFTTFHQSMDYEEFVEGIKPEATPTGITYNVHDGIFKRICNNKEIVIGQSIGIKSKYTIVGYNKDFISIKKPNNTIIQFPTLMLQQLNDYIMKNNVDCNEVVNNGRFNFKDDVNLTHPYIEPYMINGYINIIPSLLEVVAENTEDKPKVLIIDEINRGNISKILGELITLLEKDKRIGKINELTATLPYSQKSFGVPSNLYIIGTMNTADRSVGYIDYAIRRRFSFVTLTADKKAIESYYIEIGANDENALSLFENVKKLIFDKISSEFNAEDLMIGHSYFMAKDDAELSQRLEYDIKPLLREYANDGIINLNREKDGSYPDIETLAL